MDLKRGREFADLVSRYAPTPFSNGAVPTGPAFQSGSSGFLDDIVQIYPEFAEDAARMKTASSDYAFGFPTFFRAPVMPGRVGVGIITLRAGDGALRQEWIFGSTNGEPPIAYYEPAPGTDRGPLGRPVNELAAKALATGDLGAITTTIGRKPRLRDHWPTPESISEPQGQAIIEKARTAARALPAKKKGP